MNVTASISCTYVPIVRREKRAIVLHSLEKSLLPMQVCQESIAQSWIAGNMCMTASPRPAAQVLRVRSMSPGTPRLLSLGSNQPSASYITAPPRPRSTHEQTLCNVSPHDQTHQRTSRPFLLHHPWTPAWGFTDARWPHLRHCLPFISVTLFPLISPLLLPFHSPSVPLHPINVISHCFFPSPIITSLFLFSLFSLSRPLFAISSNVIFSCQQYWSPSATLSYRH